MPSIQTFKVPRSCWQHIILCTVALGILIGAGLFPAQRRRMKMDEKLVDLNIELQEQRILLPVYAQLKRILSIEVPANLIIPEPHALLQERISDIPTIFARHANLSGLELISAAPRIDSMDGESKQLLVVVLCRGEWQFFFNFMIKLQQEPFVLHIEEIDIQMTTAQKEYALHVWIAID